MFHKKETNDQKRYKPSMALIVTVVALITVGVISYVQLQLAIEEPETIVRYAPENLRPPEEDTGLPWEERWDPWDPSIQKELITGGEEFNIYCQDDEFKRYLTEYYPEYTDLDETHGKIGDVVVVWTIVPLDDNEYQEKLDTDILSGADVDMFLVDPDYALKYADTDCTIPVIDLGLQLGYGYEDDQYKYIQRNAMNSNGLVKGVTWWGCPGIMFYNREIARDVLGSDDPDIVQQLVANWDKFYQTAAIMKDIGYYMTATPYDTYRLYFGNRNSCWVSSESLSVDENMETWARNMKDMIDNGYCRLGDIGSDTWTAGLYPSGKVFCYFGQDWLINDCMAADDPTSVAGQGGWGACAGPQTFYWAKSLIYVGWKTDNMDIAADIIRALTMNADVMKEIAQREGVFVNNKQVMDDMAESDGSYRSDALGGQNLLPIYRENAEKLYFDHIYHENYTTGYDWICNEEFQAAMAGYFDGSRSYEEAVDDFNAAMMEICPWLTID